MGLNWANAFSQAGDALGKIGFEGVRSALEMDKMRLADQLAGVRQEAGFAHTEKVEKGRQEHSAGLLDRQLEHAEWMQDGRFAHDEDLQLARQKFETEQKDLDRGLTREQMQANEWIHRADRANAMAVAKMGGAIQTDPDGNVYMIGKDGATKQIMDPNDPQKPLKSAKDMTPGAKQYAETLKDRLKAIDGNQIMPPEEKATLTAKLNAELLTVITRGVGALAADTTGGAAIRPRSQAEFNAIPAGAQYINPADGKVYVKRGSPAASAPTVAAQPASTRGAKDFLVTSPGLLNWESQPRPN